MLTRRLAPNAALSWLTPIYVAAAVFLLLGVAACQNSQGTGDDAGQNTENGTGQNASVEDGASGSTAGSVHGLEGVPDYMVKGDPEAPVTMYEWSDYQ